MSWRGVSTATPQQADSTSKPGLRANRARPLHRLGLARAASPRNRATARSTAPRRLRWLGIASSPLKLQRIRRPHEPKPFGPALKHLYLFRGHAGCGPPAYLPGRLLMPQATEKARNAKADQRRTIGTDLPLDSIRRLIQRLVRRGTQRSTQQRVSYLDRWHSPSHLHSRFA